MKKNGELHAVQLDILRKFIHVAQREDLKWFAMFGTLLGAARHGGIIPWDDDIDIAMPRSEYDRLRNNTQWFEEPYFLQSPQNDPGAQTRFMKLRRSDTAAIPIDFPDIFTPGGHMGICIEIIPLDTVPDIVVAQRLQNLVLGYNRQIYASAALEECGFEEISRYKEKACLKMGGVPEFGFKDFFAELYEKACASFPVGPYYAMPVLKDDYGRRVYDKEWFKESVSMDFEGIKISVPVGWKETLVASYPEGLYEPDLRYNKREPDEEFIFDTKRSYKEYTRRYTDMMSGVDGKNIYIFGAGDSLRIWLERYGRELDVVCAFDNSKKKWGTDAYGLSVRNPAELPEIIGDNSRLIIASIYHKEIGAQLERMGIEDFYIFIDGWNYRSRR